MLDFLLTFRLLFHLISLLLGVLGLPSSLLGDSLVLHNALFESFYFMSGPLLVSADLFVCLTLLARNVLQILPLELLQAIKLSLSSSGV